MGTQQILLIVLSVIIVGVAIAVGISMFNSQSYNSNKTAIASDAQGFAAQVVQYYKTPQRSEERRVGKELKRKREKYLG